MKLYTASVTVLSGCFEGQIFTSNPCSSIEKAVAELGNSTHGTGGIVDWEHTTINTFSLDSSVEVINSRNL